MQMPTAGQRRSFESAASTYQADLAADTVVQAYLTSRGIDQAAAHGARLGVVRRPIAGHEGYRGRLALPYITPAGVVNFRFRCLRQHSCKDAGCVKYFGLEGREVSLYNVLDLKRRSGTIHVAEGEIDALTLSLAGFPAVAAPGASTWKPHWTRCLADFPEVVVIGDPDQAGKGLNKILAREARARVVRMPAGEDVNSVYTKGGADALRELINH